MHLLSVLLLLSYSSPCFCQNLTEIFTGILRSLIAEFLFPVKVLMTGREVVSWVV